MTLNERLVAIKNTWKSIKANDLQFLIAGATSHRYELTTVLNSEIVQTFETKYGFELVDEYKSYIIEVANGGVCPYNKMYSLQDSLKPLCDSHTNYDEWLNQNTNHYKLDFIVTEEKIIEYLTHRMQKALKETPPILMDCKAGGYLFLCNKSENSYFILALNGACKNEVYVLTKATKQNADGGSETYFEIYPETRFVNDQIKTLSFLEWIEDAQLNWFNTNIELDKKLSAVKIMWHNYAAWDKDKAVFGAFMHNYQLNERVSENTILEYEKNYNFSLPIEYRQYLKQVSNGGVGPFYGMYSFENSVITLNSGSKDEGNFVVHLHQHPNHYSKPFPITDDQVNAYLLNRVKNRDTQAQPIKLDKNAGGYLFLAEYGCGGYYIMPLNGNGAGEVWYLQKMNANKLTYEMTDADGNVTMSGSYGDDGDDSYFEIYPELKWNNEQASTVNFLEWIEHKQLTWFTEFAKEEPITAEDLDNENAYYPLALGNTWTHNFGGQHMITNIDSCDNGGVFSVTNSLNPLKGSMKKVNGEYFSDSHESGNMQLVLKDNLVVGDKWEVKFKANGIDCIYIFTVKEVMPSKTVEGKEYKNVAMVESDSNYLINGNLMSINAFTQTYYAKGVGTVLTTTSGVLGATATPLLSYNLK